MKNIQIIDDAANCVYDIFAATDEEFGLLFPPGQDVAFVDEVYSRENTTRLNHALSQIWSRRVRKSEAIGIHGILFYGHAEKAIYYPTRRDEQAVNPDGTLLRVPPG
ncbi:MAG: hypothetical protein QM703_17480 [Gemmatales bacterium]